MGNTNFQIQSNQKLIQMEAISDHDYRPLLKNQVKSSTKD
jgi:hypothetical protein